LTLIDTHCHLNDGEAFPNPGQAVADAWEAGVTKLIVIGVDADSSAGALEMATAHPGVYASVGWHPNYAQNFDDEGLARLKELLLHPKVVALGELGLDFHWDYATREQQHRCLMAQLELASETDKPIVLHCREAYPALLDVLETQPSRKWIFHCFSGDADDACRAIALGAWFGVDGPVTYKKADSLREIVAKLPPEKLLIETDSPWMTPHPHRSERNRPALLPLINAGLALTLGMSLEDYVRVDEDRGHRALGLAKATVNAKIGINVHHIVALEDAIDGTNVHAGLVLDSDARFGNDVGHCLRDYRAGGLSDLTQRPEVPGPMCEASSWADRAARLSEAGPDQP
jgi:TatD DNase family protein